VPADQLAAVVRTIYSDAERRGWETLSNRDRSQNYSGWVDDPRVGGILTRYMTPEAARAWIKDGPMKEYARANRGTGRYAEFGRSGGTSAADVITAAIGPTATLVPGTQGVRPLHCQALAADGTVAYLAWGEGRNFRNLVWAALGAAVQHGHEAHIVITEPFGHVTPTDEAETNRAIADRCGLELHHMREVLGKRRAGEDP